MGHDKESLDRNSVWTDFFAGALGTVCTKVCTIPRESAVFLHGIFFSSLCRKVMKIAHDRVDRDALGTAPLTMTAGMAAVVPTKSRFVIREHGVSFCVEPCPG